MNSTILAAEDEPSDAVLMKLAFERARLATRLVVVSDGQDVVDYLSGQGGYADREAHPLPRVLLLDLKMPRLSGFDVLSWLRTQPQFSVLPVVVLSSSADAADVRRAKEAGATEYFVKPNKLSELVAILRQVEAMGG